MDSPALRYPKSLHSYNPIPGRGCVLYLPLWNPACWGATFKSIDRYGHVCTNNAGVIYGSQGGGFDGTDDKITIATSTAFDISDMTCLLWIRPTQYDLTEGAYRLLNRSDVVNVDYQSYILETGKIFTVNIVFDTANINLASSAEVPLNTWNCYGWTVSGTAGILYKNGVSDDTASGTGTRVNQTLNIILGTFSGNSQWYEGLIGECWLYNRALSAGEILFLYNQTRGRYS